VIVVVGGDILLTFFGRKTASRREFVDALGDIAVDMEVGEVEDEETDVTTDGEEATLFGRNRENLDEKGLAFFRGDLVPFKQSHYY